jgi:hypothetical protein
MVSAIRRTPPFAVVAGVYDRAVIASIDLDRPLEIESGLQAETPPFTRPLRYHAARPPPRSPLDVAIPAGRPVR